MGALDWTKNPFSVGGDATPPVATLQPSSQAGVPSAPVLPGGLTPVSGSSATTATTATGTTSRLLPSWIPHSADTLTPELADQLNTVKASFDTSAVDKASAEQQAQDLTTGMQAANSAATEYAARVRQQGGSAASAGLIRAEGQVKARDAAGAAKVEAAKYDVAQREAAAGQSAQIASTLANLRTSYLGTLAGVSTGTSTTSSQSGANQALEGKAAPFNTPGGPGSGSFFPGYVTDQGPVTPSSNSNALVPKVYGSYPGG